MEVHQKRKNGGLVDLVSRIEANPFLEPVRTKVKDLATDSRKLIDLCEQQVDEFLEKELCPALQPYREQWGATAQLSV